MIENVDHEKLVTAIDEAIAESKRSPFADPQFVAAYVLRKVNCELFADSSEGSSRKRNEFCAAILPLVNERLRFQNNKSEYDTRLDRAIAAAIQSIQEDGTTTLEPELIGAACFRVMHPELVRLHTVQGRKFSWDRMKVILGRVLEFQNARVSETGLLN